ncbi:MAG TPA: efflux RND transporter permease subunit [Propionibacteriaceae bacterium]
MTLLTRVSLANRLIVGLVTLAIIVFGVLSIFALKQELLPSITAPTAFVSATYPGASPQIMAKEISTPIEEAAKGVSGVTKVSSTSTNGQASINVEWEFGLDSDKIVSDIRNAVDSVGPTLPDTVTTEVFTGNTEDIPVLVLAVASNAPLAKSGQLVDDVAVPALAGIEGVRQVTLSGQNTTELDITLRPADLRKHDVAAAAVTESIRSQALVTPAGTSYAGNTELAIEVGSTLDTVKKVQALSVASPDGPVALRQLADVEVKAVNATSVARSDGRPALSLTVFKETDADAVEISHAVNELLPGLEQRLGDNTTFSSVFDQAPLIEQSIDDLAVEGGLGLTFAVLVILLFLLSLRSTIITAISIPLSLLIAMIALRLGDYSLNIFTLAALTVAVGRVVDDSIVVIENIKRRALGHETLTAGDIVASVKEVAGAVTASTLTTVAVFLPVAVVSGVVGELFRPFAITIAVALAASLLVSMTIVPVLAYWFMHRGLGRKARAAALAAAAAGTASGEELKVTRLQRGYLPVLRWSLRHPVVTLAVALVVFVATLGSATLLKTDFLGSVTDQTTLTVTQELPAGTRLSATSAAAKKVESVLAASPEVKSYLTTIGGGGLQQPGTASGASTASMTVTLAEGREADDLRPELQNRLDAVKGAGEITVASAAGATNNDVTVTVSGDNTDTLRVGAEKIEGMLESVDGLIDVRSDLAQQRKVLRVDVDLRKAADQGFTQGEVGQAVASSLQGTKIGTVTLEGESRDILVRTQNAGTSPADVGNLELPVSQIQQQKATDRASDKLTEKQDKASKEAEKEADEAAADQREQLDDQRRELQTQRADLAKQREELVDQRTKAREALADTRKALRQLEDNKPEPPPAPEPGAPDLPVTQVQLQQQQYAESLQKYAEQLAQLNSAVEQSEKGIEQLNDQLDAADEQADKSDEAVQQADEQARKADEQTRKTKEQREEQEKLADEQKAIADVRAQPIRVKDVATVKQVLAPTTVIQIDGVPSVTVTATPEAQGGDLGALTETIQQRLDSPEGQTQGVTATLGGSSQDQQEAFSQLGLAMLAAIVLVFIIMVATFGSLLQPLILMISIPFAATGAVVGLLVTDTPLGVPSMIGLLMLIGIVVTNAIVLIDLINQYRRSGEDLQAAVIDGARLRLRPIIMTACATIFALIPMGLGLTGGGAFISRPLAVVVIGGLVSSTVLTLVLVPVLYTLIERRGERRRLQAQENERLRQENEQRLRDDEEASITTQSHGLTP